MWGRCRRWRRRRGRGSAAAGRAAKARRHRRRLRRLRGRGRGWGRWRRGAAGGAAAGGGDGDDNAKHATTLGYYHFDSTGRKFKNKWDDFDVDAECDRVDQQEALEAVHKRALGLGSKLEKLLTDKVDTLRSADAATVAKRKQLAAHINNVMLARVDRAKERVAKALALEKRQ